MALAPNGRSIAFVGSESDGVDRLWHQPLDSLTAVRVEGSEDAAQPFWSPDSSALAFFAGGRLKRLDLSGGVPRTLATVSPVGLAGSWGKDGVLLYAAGSAGVSEDHRGLLRGSAGGGSAVPVPLPPGIDPEAQLRWPRFLPDGRTYLVSVQSGDPEHDGLYAASLDGGSAQRIVPATSSAEYADGHLFYVDGAMLIAQPFDVARRRMTAPPVLLADPVLVNLRTGRASFSVSDTGVLAYRQPLRSRLEWFDRRGSSLGVLGPTAVYHDFSIAPDGERVAAAILDQETGTHDLWILEPGQPNTRVTFSPNSSESPARWSADGTRLAYASNDGGRWRVFVKKLAAGAEEELIAESTGAVAPSLWNGEAVVISRFNPLVELKVHRSDRVRLASDASIGNADSVSPDLRWVARSRDSNSRLYLEAVAPARGSWHVAERASQVLWRADAGELYYLADDRTLMAVRVGSGAPTEISPPVPLFTAATVAPSWNEGSVYDAAPDGQRFLVKIPVEPPAIVIVSNWKSLLDEQGTSSRAGTD